MWNAKTREQTWADLARPWDVIIIGGGITGAGILRQAVMAGLRAVLLEANDFAFGTSSRSSKLVHGGFRYLRNRQFSVTYESVHERERLLREAPQLVTPLDFIIPAHKSSPKAAAQYGLGVFIYDIMAPKWAHSYLLPHSLSRICPALSRKDLIGGYRYQDGLTDDSRLVLRVLREAVSLGGVALNYAKVEGLLTGADGQVRGAAVRDGLTGQTVEVLGTAVINATGPWADELRAGVGGEPKLRKSRGSHIIVPRHRFPICSAFTLAHPWDSRVLFAIPWEGVTLIGTTDLDHDPELERTQAEPTITSEEVDYLLAAATHAFPSLGLTRADIRSTFAGLRPLVRAGADQTPSQVSRASILLQENGLVTITGGKLTTYRRMGHAALQAIRTRLRPGVHFDPLKPMFKTPPALFPEAPISCEMLQSLVGRYGDESLLLLLDADPAELTQIDELPLLWAELRWAARQEGVQHLDDLLLRRVRLGLLAEQGGLPHLERIRTLVQSELGWDDARWEAEASHYAEVWKSCYYLGVGN